MHAAGEFISVFIEVVVHFYLSKTLFKISFYFLLLRYSRVFMCSRSLLSRKWH